MVESQTPASPGTAMQPTMRPLDPFSALPPELKIIITEPLSFLSRISLGLTCKIMYRFLCPSGRFYKLNMDERAEMLFRLERGNPNIFLCLGCMKLWPFIPHHSDGWLAQDHRACSRPFVYQQSSLSQPPSSDGALSPPRGEFSPRWFQRPLDVWRLGHGYPEISLSQAHLVMLRQWRGTRYGLPLKSLEQSFCFTRFLDPRSFSASKSHFPLEQHTNGPPIRHLSRPMMLWCFRHHYSAETFKAELYICRHHKIAGPPVAPAQFADLLDHVRLPVCHHIYGGIRQRNDQIRDWQWEFIPELTDLRCRRDHHHRTRVWDGDYHVQSRRFCFHCTTDYDITLHCSQKNGWTMTLTTYHRLGKCYLMDQTWLGLNHCPAGEAEPPQSPELQAIYASDGDVPSWWWKNESWGDIVLDPFYKKRTHGDVRSNWFQAVSEASRWEEEV